MADQATKPKIADVKKGLTTADDLRFIRYWWEVTAEGIAMNPEETAVGKGWAPFARGSWLGKFFADISMVAYWRNDGEEIRGFANSEEQVAVFLSDAERTALGKMIDHVLLG